MNDGLELPSSLRMRAGETWEARLPGLGSAGYDWQVDVDGPAVVEVDLRAIEPERTTPPGGPPPDNYNVDQLLMILAVRTGSTMLRLRQLRPWEVESILRTHDMSVTVE